MDPDPCRDPGGEPDGDWRPDVLGAGYRALTIDLGPDPDGEGEVRATLVRHDAARTPVRAAVLYVHGLSDYFFQTHLAEGLGSRGIRLYALDLRKCGRSLLAGQSPHYTTDLAHYDRELDAALEVIGRLEPGVPVVAAAHSTGGLVVPLWLADRRAADPEHGLDPVVGMVLNSPWFELDVPPRVRPAVDGVVSVLSRLAPRRALPLPTSDLYGASTHSSRDGDFDYDLGLKPFGGVGIRPGWLAAVRRGHRRLQSGLDLDLPLLLLRSTHSAQAGRGTRGLPDGLDVTDTDVVLDVRSMRRYAGRVSNRVTDLPIPGARHDVFLSRPEPLAAALDALTTWLETLLSEPTDQHHEETR